METSGESVIFIYYVKGSRNSEYSTMVSFLRNFVYVYF